MQGKIYKALSGFYYVHNGVNNIVCTARGRFRNEKESPLVGDIVEYSVEDSGSGRIEKIEPRKNHFIRPAVANIDQIVFVASEAIPETEPFLIDRLSVIAEKQNCLFSVCINKEDLCPGTELARSYEKTGFTVIRTSALDGTGIEALRIALLGKTSVLTGNSGVGKSSLLNCLKPELNLKTENVSEKLGRGKHTTRHIELYHLEKATYVTDTPGFSSFDIETTGEIEKDQLQYLFPEFHKFLGQCHFDNCVHMNEPDCAVKSAVAAGEISETRYNSYKRLYEMSQATKKW